MDDPWQTLPAVRRMRLDMAEQVGLVAQARRQPMLYRHWHRLRREDLEDCLSQATLELLASVRAGVRFTSSAHIANALEQRFRSRVSDRLRALSGRSPIQAALEDAVALGAESERTELADVRLGVEDLVMLRLRLDGFLRRHVRGAGTHPNGFQPDPPRMAAGSATKIGTNL